MEANKYAANSTKLSSVYAGLEHDLLAFYDTVVVISW